MLQKFTNFSVKLVQKYLPDPFLFAAILSLLTLLLGVTLTRQTPMAMIMHWSGSFWSLLAFTMQMVLVLVTGHTLAQAPVIKKVLKSIASIPKTPGGAIALVTFISSVACWINWGFGLVVGALLAKETARNVKVDYRLLIASAYSGFLLWHGGLSGSIPLSLATPTTDFYTLTRGTLTGPISTNDTIFSGFNMAIVLVLLITLPIVNRAMHPKNEEDIVTVDPSKLEDEKDYVPPTNMTPAEKLENSPIISLLVGVMGMTFIFTHFMSHGFNLTLDLVNFIFLFLAIILHGTPIRFLIAVSAAIKGTSGIIIQFPFYAGIMGMVTGANAAGLSLATLMSTGFVSISTQTTFPLFTFLSAGLVNVFVPSGGGQWAIQAPIMMPAGYTLGVDPAKTAMAIAWGEVWTNLIQPFWALPALGIAGLSAKDIMGFCIVNLFYVGAVIAAIFLIF